MFNIMVIKVDEIREDSLKVQSLLTKHHCSIKTRLGLHEAGDVCGSEGCIMLNLAGEQNDIKKLEGELNNLHTVKAQMVSM